jgi:heme-degrading monooxygenase HmoA
MLVVIFEVFPKPEHRQDYFDIAADLKTHLAQVDGCLSIERFESLVTEGKILSLSFWRDEAALSEWRNVFEHRQAQARGRDQLFEDYRIRVAEVTRDYTLEKRGEVPKDSIARHG